MGVQAILERLGRRPPQTLLLEGGTEKTRLEMAMAWAKIVNCPQAMAARARGIPGSGCGECPVCRQLAANESLDLHIYDGRISNKQDEETPGPVRALTIDNMRELKSRATTAPHGNGKRIAIFQGMIKTREEALNSLLKTLEDPSPYTLFVLLTPQRAQLLPTLVSRSLSLTLPWSGCKDNLSGLEDWEQKLALFLGRGTGFLEDAGKKGSLDVTTAAQLVLGCQKALAAALYGQARTPLQKVLAPLAQRPADALVAGRWANEAQSMLANTVAPARVMEGFCTKLFTLLHPGK